MAYPEDDEGGGALLLLLLLLLVEPVVVVVVAFVAVLGVKADSVGGAGNAVDKEAGGMTVAAASSDNKASSCGCWVAADSWELPPLFVGTGSSNKELSASFNFLFLRPIFFCIIFWVIVSEGCPCEKLVCPHKQEANGVAAAAAAVCLLNFYSSGSRFSFPKSDL